MAASSRIDAPSSSPSTSYIAPKVTWDEDVAISWLKDHPAHQGEFDGGLSVWFVVLPGKDGSLLDQTVVDLQETHGGASPWPAHCTAFSPVFATESEADNALKTIADTVRQFSVRVVKADTCDLFHQNVYLLLERSEALLAARDAVAGAFGVDGASSRQAFKPHISLVYGGHDMEARARIAAAVDVSLCEAGREFTIGQLQVWKCHGPTHTWGKVACVDLKE